MKQWNYLVPLRWVGPLTSAASFDLDFHLYSISDRQLLLYLSVLITFDKKTMLRRMTRRTGIPRNQEWPCEFNMFWNIWIGIWIYVGIFSIFQYVSVYLGSEMFGYLGSPPSTQNCSSATKKIRWFSFISEQLYQSSPDKLEWCSRGGQEEGGRPSQEGKGKWLSSCPIGGWRAEGAGNISLKTLKRWSWFWILFDICEITPEGKALHRASSSRWRGCSRSSTHEAVGSWNKEYKCFVVCCSKPFRGETQELEVDDGVVGQPGRGGEKEGESLHRSKLNETKNQGNPRQSWRRQKIATCQVLVHRDPTTSEWAEGGEDDKGEEEQEDGEGVAYYHNISLEKNKENTERRRRRRSDRSCSRQWAPSNQIGCSRSSPTSNCEQWYISDLKQENMRRISINTKFHCWLDVSTTPLNQGSLWLPVLGKSFSCFRSKKTLYLTKMWVEPWIMGVDGMISEKSSLSHFHAQECRCHWSIYKLGWNLNTLTSCM